MLVPVGVAPAFTGLGGPVYLAVSALGGGGVPAAGLAAVPQPRRRDGDARGEDGLYDVKAERPAARNLFAFSILYLFALFAALLGEQPVGRRALELLR